MTIPFRVLSKFMKLLKEADIPFALISRVDDGGGICNFNDIDIVVEKKNVNNILFFLFEKLKNENHFIFNIVINDYSVQLYISFDDYIFNLDVLSEFTFRGIPYIRLIPSNNLLYYYYEIPCIISKYVVSYSVLRNLLWRGMIDKRHTQLISNEFIYNKNFFLEKISDAFGVRYAKKVLEYLEGKRERLQGIGFVFVLRAFAHAPWRSLIGMVQHFKLLSRRFFFYPGLFVVVLGSDGSGKTTLLNQLSVDQNLFQKVKSHHLFPGFLYGAIKLRTRDVPVENPHDCVRRGHISSILKLFFWLVEFSLGFIFRLWKPLEEGQLVLFDRYFHDLLVDSKRYRYGGPMWLARFVGKLVPQPDLFILLDASPGVLQSRKQEVPFAETARQRDEYLQFVRSQKNGVVIDAAQSLEEVVANVWKSILDVLKERTKKRLGDFW